MSNLLYLPIIPVKPMDKVLDNASHCIRGQRAV